MEDMEHEATRREWEQRLKDIDKPLLVPGRWWEGEPRKNTMFACKIVKVLYFKKRGKFEFVITCVHQDEADDEYIMLWPDVRKYVIVARARTHTHTHTHTQHKHKTQTQNTKHKTQNTKHKHKTQTHSHSHERKGTGFLPSL